VITEKRFVVRHNAFWHRLLPMAPAYIRALNTNVERYGPPVEEASEDNRGVVNELAFRLFALSVESNCSPRKLGTEQQRAAAAATVDFIRRFRQFNRAPVLRPTGPAIAEALGLAENIHDYFEPSKNGKPVVWPRFAGCGIVDECCGDAILGSTLVEVKANAGPFRGRDIRQVLCYAALNFARKERELVSFSLVNPRTAVCCTHGIEQLCQQAGGASANHVLGDIVDYISEPFAKPETA
jgi:hypothetical protein